MSGNKGRILALVLAIMVVVAGLTCALAEAGDGVSAAYAAYAGVLQENETAIREYWQGGGMVTDNGYVASVEPRAIALADIMGDDVPELIFIARSGYYEAALYIYTCENGAAKLLATQPNWDTYGGSSSVSCVYQAAGSRDLYGMNAGNYDGYYHWASADDVALQADSLVRMYDGDDPMSFQNGQSVANSVYDTGIGAYPTDAEKLLIYSTYISTYGTDYWDGRELIGAEGMESSAMTYDEAMALFGGAAPAAAEGEVFYPEITEVEIIDIEEVSVEPVDGIPSEATDVEPVDGIPSEAADVEPADEVPGEAAAPVGGLDIPAETIDQEIVNFIDIRSSATITVHADGSFDAIFASEDGIVSCTGQIDRMVQISARAYELHIANMAPDSPSDWGWQPFRADATLTLVLPGANPSELDGYVEPTITQMEVYGPEGDFYESGNYYVGFESSNGRIFLPYEVFQYN